ncbi:hypothetical protein ABPG74_020984 [Tetrahymena malaccensis]
MRKNSKRLTIFLLVIMFAINQVYCIESIRNLGSKRVSSRSSRSSSSRSSGSSGSSTSNSGSGGSMSDLALILAITIPVTFVVIIIIIICICKRQRLAQQKVAAQNGIQLNNQFDINKQMQQCNPIQYDPYNQQQQAFNFPNEQNSKQQQQQLQIIQQTPYQQNTQQVPQLYFQQPAIQQASVL